MSEQLYYEITIDEQSQDFLEKRGIGLAHGLQNKEGEGWYPKHTLTPRICPTDCHICLNPSSLWCSNVLHRSEFTP